MRARVQVSGETHRIELVLSHVSGKRKLSRARRVSVIFSDDDDDDDDDERTERRVRRRKSTSLSCLIHDFEVL